MGSALRVGMNITTTCFAHGPYSRACTECAEERRDATLAQPTDNGLAAQLERELASLERIKHPTDQEVERHEMVRWQLSHLLD